MRSIYKRIRLTTRNLLKLRLVAEIKKAAHFRRQPFVNISKKRLLCFFNFHFCLTDVEDTKIE